MTTTPQESLSKTLEDARNTVLWLEHRLPNGYGEVPHVKRTLASLDAALSQQAAQEQEPVAWVRFRSDGGIEGPILDSALDDIRRKSGAWTALYAAAPVNPAEQEKAECPGCNGRGLIGGWAGAGSGYETDDCPLCTESSQPAPSTAAQEREEMYFLQDKRSYVGNCPMWWAKDGKGYTTRIDQAHRYTKEQAFAQNRCRDTDIPWPCEVVEPLQRPTIDIQDLHKADYFKSALAHKGAQGEQS